MKTREEQIEELAKAIYATGVALDGTDYGFGVYDSDDHFHRMASALIAAGFGDVTEWKLRAEVAEKEREEYRKSTRIALRGIEILKRNCLRVFCTDFPSILQQAEREIEEEKGE